MPKTTSTHPKEKKVSPEVLEKIYEIAKKDYYKQLDNKNESISLLCKQYDVNDATVKHYIGSIKHMIDGSEYQRTMSEVNTEHAFEKIKEDFGLKGLENAVRATIQHAKYYHHSNKKGSQRRNIEKLCDKWVKKYDLNLLFVENENDMMKLHQSDIDLQMCRRFEGAAILAPPHTRYERDPKNRASCLRTKGYKCVVCKFDFEEIYGERGKHFIHVHHVNPLSEIDEEHLVDPETDLCPVCPNCHAMLHRGESITVEELQAIMQLRKVIAE